MSGRKIEHHVVLDCDQVTPVGNIVICEGSAHAYRLKRTTSGVVYDRVVPEDREVGNVTPGIATVRYCAKHSACPLPCNRVHIRSLGILKGSLAPELLERLVCHTVPEDYNDTSSVRESPL